MNNETENIRKEVFVACLQELAIIYLNRLSRTTTNRSPGNHHLSRDMLHFSRYIGEAVIAVITVVKTHKGAVLCSEQCFLKRFV
jgi:hypothetical protein